MSTKTTKKTSAKKTVKRKYQPDPNKKPYAETVAESIIAALEQGTAPWQKPWEPGRPGAGLPHNPVSGTTYKGINLLSLIMTPFSDPRWMTYKQATDAGAQVRKGSKGTMIQYWSWEKMVNKTDADGKPVIDDKGKPVKQKVRLEKPTPFYATVFNAEQIDGLEPYKEPEALEESWQAIERVEKIVENSGADIRHQEQGRAYYASAADHILMPMRHQFPRADQYYATLLHELGHWTGHKSRLNRDMSGSFGSISYAKEELRAEIASMMLGMEMGIGHDPGQHVAYVESWIDVLKNDPLEIFRAASDAEKIREYMLGMELSKDYQPKSRHTEAQADPSP